MTQTTPTNDDLVRAYREAFKAGAEVAIKKAAKLAMGFNGGDYGLDVASIISGDIETMTRPNVRLPHYLLRGK